MEDVEEVRKKNRSLAVKAYLIGDGLSQSTAIQEKEGENQFQGTGAIEPPYRPEMLAGLYEMSSALLPNVEAYMVNIDSFGHRYEPVIDFQDEAVAFEQVFDAILAERAWDADQEGDEPVLAKLKPSESDVKSRVEEMTLRARLEKSKLRAFFSFAAQGCSFPKLRSLTRRDKEVLGNSYWEVLRNKKGKIARFVYVPGWTMRLRKLIKEPVKVMERMQISDLSSKDVEVTRQFRTFVQELYDGRKVYFKEFKDPRSVSRTTGHVFKDDKDLKRTEGKAAKSANEIIHFKVDSILSPYGIPRWMGAFLSVMGSRSVDEVNYFYFDNKAVPPLAILVSGGKLSTSSVKKIEDYIENEIKGRKNFHKILVIEAVSPKGKAVETGAHAPRPIIELKPLTEAQMMEGQFQKYDERNIEKVGMQFRLPRILRGDSRDFNRATASMAIKHAEEQVFQPERDETDFFINADILTELGIKLWRFVSNAPITRDPEKMAKEVKDLSTVGVLTPEDGREIAKDIFNKDFKSIRDPWVKQPVSFTLAGIQTGQRGPVQAENKTPVQQSALPPGTLQPAQGDPPDVPSIANEHPQKIAQWLMRIRTEMSKAQSEAEMEIIRQEREAMGIQPDGTLIIEVPPETMAELVDDA